MHRIPSRLGYAALAALFALNGCASSTPHTASSCDARLAPSLGNGLSSFLCSIYNFFTAQTASPQAVADEYTKDGAPLPEQAKLLAYQLKVSPKAVVNGGSEVRVIADIKVVTGSQDSNPVIEQETQLYAPGAAHRPIKSLRKIANETHVAGGYRTVFSLKLPVDAPVGTYPVKTVIYLNGTPVARKTTRSVVAHAGLPQKKPALPPGAI
jgi:hypothetical protein